MSLAWEIRQAIRQELDETAPFHEFIVHSTHRDGPIWKVFIDPFLSRDGLDESLEESAAWWTDSGGGTAEVLATDADSDLLTLRSATSAPPSSGSPIRVYPPRFLSALENVWHDEEWAEQCELWLANAFKEECRPRPLRSGYFPWLRRGQQAALKLPGHKAAFLWGPPGTGKTTTLGALLAAYLLTYPGHRVLLLSTTNSAVDLALISVDDSLKSIRAEEARRRCFRLGSNFRAANYIDREHLIPRASKSLLGQLAALEANRPEPAKLREIHRWRNEINSIRSQLCSQTDSALTHSNLVAMTAARAVFTHETLRDHAPFDFIVFDEGSQVNLPYALALAPLAKSCLFAGDPKQLAPVVRSKKKTARQWLGESMFHFADHPDAPNCFLHEQSRMARAICNLVSEISYDGRLKIAADAARDPEWRRARSIEGAPPRWKQPILLYEVFKEGAHSQKYRGRIRQQSAFFITQIISSILVHTPAEDILVLTPFRAQRNLIRNFLRLAGLPDIPVTTIHRAQGSERHTIIFDPVDGSSTFLQNESGQRLINVALSRAQARLIMLMSERDLQNPILESVSLASSRLNSGAASPTLPASWL